jgi:hypothetical protein
MTRNSKSREGLQREEGKDKGEAPRPERDQLAKNKEERWNHKGRQGI